MTILKVLMNILCKLRVEGDKQKRKGGQLDSRACRGKKTRVGNLGMIADSAKI